MKIRLFAVACIAFSCSYAAEDRAVLHQYCAPCHNNATKSGGLSLEGLPRAAPEWEKVVVKLRAGMMPPAGAPRPASATIDTLARSLEAELDQAAATDPNPGRPALHR